MSTTKSKEPLPIFTDIRGKRYETVASRIKRFRHRHPDYSLASEVLVLDDKHIIIKATIATPDGRVLAVGLAEEVRGASNINRTSALENGETSAWGRALANLGIDESGSIASAEEVSAAIEQQTQKKPTQKKPTQKKQTQKKQVKLATSQQKEDIRSHFLGLSKDGIISLRNDFLRYTKISLPNTLTPLSFKLSDVEHLLTSEGADSFLNRPSLGEPND